MSGGRDPGLDAAAAAGELSGFATARRSRWSAIFLQLIGQSLHSRSHAEVRKVENRLREER